MADRCMKMCSTSLLSHLVKASENHNEVSPRYGYAHKGKEGSVVEIVGKVNTCTSLLEIQISRVIMVNGMETYPQN